LRHHMGGGVWDSEPTRKRQPLLVVFKTTAIGH